MNNTRTVWLTSEQALMRLQDMGVGKRRDEVWSNIVEPLSERQWKNWIGSGKVMLTVIGGERYFSASHIEEVGKRYIESKGKAYSIYYDRNSGEVIEFVNTYQCAQMWDMTDRQAQNIIASGKVPDSLKIGNEYFVDREMAKQYQEAQQHFVNFVPKHLGIRL